MYVPGCVYTLSNPYLDLSPPLTYAIYTKPPDGILLISVYLAGLAALPTLTEYPVFSFTFKIYCFTEADRWDVTFQGRVG